MKVVAKTEAINVMEVYIEDDESFFTMDLPPSP